MKLRMTVFKISHQCADTFTVESVQMVIITYAMVSCRSNLSILITIFERIILRELSREVCLFVPALNSPDKKYLLICAQLII